MMEVPSEIILCRCPVEGGVAQYEQSVRRWHENPHYVNRRISVAVSLLTAEVLHPENSHDLLHIILKSGMNSEMAIAEVKKSLESAGVLFKNENISSNEEHNLFVEVKKLLPRYNKVFKEMLQVTILDSVQKEFIFLGLPHREGIISSPLSPVHPFSLKFVCGEMLLVIFGSSVLKDKSTTWLKDCLFPKLQRWAEESLPNSSGIQSLSLIQADQYTLLYQKLKEKYGQKLVEIWPERTDPQKFVYEDVAIATYLLLLWDKQRIETNRPDWRQFFVDMGCGNGLLVYILSSEGYPGLGVDIRKRGIWDMYPASTQLKVQTFVPSNCNIFPEADWIIGNHSDELTPWIPVIAARSSYNCSFFLLPCCAYVFSGRKYQRLNSSRSQYSEYMGYVKSICEKCGFKTDLDRLKIPSTKRVCLVGSERNYSINKFEEKQAEIMEYVRKSTEQQDETQNASSNEQLSFDTSSSVRWTPHFTAREPKEEVRNCSQIQKNIKDNIVEHVVKLLLAEKCCITIKDNERGKLWNAGCSMKLGEIAATLPQNLLAELKKECGGLQTLLKNNHEIFSVKGGSVKLAMPATVDEKLTSSSKKAKRKGELKLKQKPCWFFNFHPDGCPLENEQCSFSHTVPDTNSFNKSPVLNMNAPIEN